MKFIHRMTVANRLEMPLRMFLEEHALVRDVCREHGTTPAALILDGLVPNKYEGEDFGDWLVRQVREILAHGVQTDDWQGEDGAWVGWRTQCVLDSLAFSAEDRQWLLQEYGGHPEVVAVWEAACRMGKSRALAA
jgi:hypothetical protein